MIVGRSIDQFVPGPEGMAGRYDLGGVLLSVDAPISPRGALRIDITDQARGGLGSSQYRGRSRARKYRQLRAASSNITGVSEGDGNASAFGGSRRYHARAGSAASSRAMRELGQNDSRFNTIAAGQSRER